MGIRCVTVSVVDNITNGDRSVSLRITSGGTSSVPVLLYPDTILVNIVDDDRKLSYCSSDNSGAYLARGLRGLEHPPQPGSTSVYLLV